MMKLINPPGLAKPVGYSHGVLAEGKFLALAGQIGWDANSKIVSPDFAAQFRQALINMVTVLETAGGGPENLVSLRMYVTDKQKYLAAAKEVGEHYRAIIGRHFPAMALVQVADLLEEGALVEIEGMAVMP
jgi:enamine deaminase RidA (YjgF/YER057c/UK114 family)